MRRCSATGQAQAPTYWCFDMVFYFSRMGLTLHGMKFRSGDLKFKRHPIGAVWRQMVLTLHKYVACYYNPSVSTSKGKKECDSKMGLVKGCIFDYSKSCLFQETYLLSTHIRRIRENYARHHNASMHSNLFAYAILFYGWVHS